MQGTTGNTIRTYSRQPELVEEKRRLIVQRALPLFLKRGFSGTSVRLIAEACGISMGALYNYIGTKDDIAFLVADEIRTETLEFVGNSFDPSHPTDSLRAVFSGWCRLCDKYQDNAVFMYREFGNLNEPVRKQIADADERLIALFEMVLSSGVRSGDFKISDTKLLALDMYISGHMWAFRRWYLHDRYDLERYIARQTEVFLNSATKGC